MPRYLSKKGASLANFKAALIFSMTTRGIPFVYYGTEHAFKGGQDPQNREVLT